jgi:predicted RNA binding protein YcfA (HicA-like mRNA interferase family)
MEMARALERDGWQFVRQSGSHRHYSHPGRPGVVVTVPLHAG